jgi:hypothetical protein
MRMIRAVQQTRDWHRLVARVAALVLGLAAGCGGPDTARGDATSGTRTGSVLEPDTTANPFLQALDTTADVRCAADLRTSQAIPFDSVYLGPAYDEAIGNSRVLKGPRAREVVRDSAQWPVVWRRLVDRVPVYPVAFGDDAIIFVATQTYGGGPTLLRVAGLRRCRATGRVVAAIQELNPRGFPHDVPTRGLAAVRVRRSLLGDGLVSFVSLPVDRR